MVRAAFIPVTAGEPVSMQVDTDKVHRILSKKKIDCSVGLRHSDTICLFGVLIGLETSPHDANTATVGL
ncbi:hypothetical protein Holit_00945 [Hollandina sp. SP2]